MRLIAALILSAAGAFALELPLKINFQGRLVDPSTGNPRNGNFNMTFRLYRGASGGSAVFTETQNNVPVSNGVFSVQLGSAALLSADLLDHPSAYLSIQVGADSEMAPRQQLVMAPYAYTAAQLMGMTEVGFNAGTAYSTFTSAGNWTMPHGLTATTGTFTTGLFTGTGQSTYSVTAASGALFGGPVNAPSYIGSGADLADVRVEVSSVSQTNTASIATTEVVMSSVTITPSRANSKVFIQAQVGLNRSANALMTWSIRIRRNIGAACTTASTQVGTTNTHTVANTAGTSALVSTQKVDEPATTSQVFYCLTLQGNSGTAQTADERNMVIFEVR